MPSLGRSGWPAWVGGPGSARPPTPSRPTLPGCSGSPATSPLYTPRVAGLALRGGSSLPPGGGARRGHRFGPPVLALDPECHGLLRAAAPQGRPRRSPLAFARGQRRGCALTPAAFLRKQEAGAGLSPGHASHVTGPPGGRSPHHVPSPRASLVLRTLCQESCTGRGLPHPPTCHWRSAVAAMCASMRCSHKQAGPSRIPSQSERSEPASPPRRARLTCAGGDA